MKVLIAGGGGREHALAWKAAQSPRVDEVLVAPGNAGTALEPGVRNVPIAADDIDALVALARDEKAGLTIVGPEAPLVAGIADAFADAGLPCFGPTAAAARLEGSKAYMKDFLARHAIPTAGYACFTELEPALAEVASREAPMVIKADGLAAGKGVIVAPDRDTAAQAVRDMLGAGRFGAAGSRIVIEDCLVGEEASFIAIVAGEQVLPLASSQDHKTRDEGDRGPNTGGMGAYSPAPVVDAAVHGRVMEEVMLPTVRALAAEGNPYLGFLYAGLMIDAQGTPRVLEFNCRFGDPETQPVLMRLRSDLVELCLAATQGRLAGMEVEWDPRVAVGVVLAAGGYPASYRKGDVITGLPEAEIEGEKVFHAGTRPFSSRVLCPVALGPDVAAARERVYALAGRIDWRDMFYRRDIGHRALTRD